MSRALWTTVFGFGVMLTLATGSRSPHAASDLSSAPRQRDSPADTQFGVGRRVSADEIAARDITVFPTGAGLPAGQGSAVDGALVYQTQCAVCHGDRGQGHGFYPPLVGGIGSLTSKAPQLTVGSYWPYATTVFDYTRRAMPYEAAGTLSANETYAVTAYLLFLNGIVGEHDVLDQDSLPRVNMPNRDGFVDAPRR